MILTVLLSSFHWLTARKMTVFDSRYVPPIVAISGTFLGDIRHFLWQVWCKDTKIRPRLQIIRQRTAEESLLYGTTTRVIYS